MRLLLLRVLLKSAAVDATAASAVLMVKEWILQRWHWLWDARRQVIV